MFRVEPRAPPDRVVLDAVDLDVLGEHGGVVDLVQVEPFVMHRVEVTFTRAVLTG